MAGAGVTTTTTTTKTTTTTTATTTIAVTDATTEATIEATTWTTTTSTSDESRQSTSSTIDAMKTPTADSSLPLILGLAGAVVCVCILIAVVIYLVIGNNDDKSNNDIPLNRDDGNYVAISALSSDPPSNYSVDNVAEQQKIPPASSEYGLLSLPDSHDECKSKF
jgi:hypothetical protein